MNAELKDIVFAPLEAISEANSRLNREVEHFIQSISKRMDDGGTCIELDTINIQYNQIRNNPLDESNQLKDTISLNVPWVSLCPISFLKVSKSRVSFSVEVQSIVQDRNELKIYSSMTSGDAKNGAKSDITFDIELETLPCPEGLMRVVDDLNLKSVPKILKTIPVDMSGKALDQEEAKKYSSKQECHQGTQELLKKIRVLNQLIDEEIKNSGYRDVPNNPYDLEDEEGIQRLERTNDFICQYRKMKSSYEEQLKDLRNKQIMLM